MSPQFLFRYCLFEYIRELQTFPIDTTNISMQGCHLIVCYFRFDGLLFAITLEILKPVSCFHMTSFIYGVKRVREVDTSFRFHQKNVMSDSIVSVNIGHFATSG